MLPHSMPRYRGVLAENRGVCQILDSTISHVCMYVLTMTYYAAIEYLPALSTPDAGTEWRYDKEPVNEHNRHMH